MNAKQMVLFVMSLNVMSGVYSAQSSASKGESVAEKTPPVTQSSTLSKDTSLKESSKGTSSKDTSGVKSKPNDASGVTPKKTGSEDTLHKDNDEEDVKGNKSVSKDDELIEKEKNKDVLDTVNAQSTSGNWVLKNYWWKKIQDIYSDIRDAFNTVMTSRMKFFEKRSEVDKELDTFYRHIGLEQGPLQDVLEYALQVIEKEKEDQGYLDKKERAFLEKVKEKQRQLEQLKEDIKAIEELDQKIDDALEVVLQQVDVCNKYMQEAWNISRDVARELSDKEARKQYYDTKGLLEDVHKVHQYLIGPFNQYFEQMIKSVHDHTRGVAAQLETLNNSGLDLRKEAHIFEAEDEELERKKSEEQESRKKELERRKQKKADQEQTKETSGILAGTVTTIQKFFGSVVDYATGMAIAVKNFFDSIIATVKGWFFSAEEKVEAVKKTVKKEAQKIEKESEKEVYNAEKDAQEGVKVSAEYVKDKAQDIEHNLLDDL